MHSRETVVGLLTTTITVITNKSALWIIQPIAASIAALAFLSLGFIFRQVIARSNTTSFKNLLAWMIYAWAILSASSQEFGTLSFISQYLSITVWFGACLYLIENQISEKFNFVTRSAILGLTLRALMYAYPEMIAPAAAMLIAFEFASTPQNKKAFLRTFIFCIACLSNSIYSSWLCTADVSWSANSTWLRFVWPHFSYFNFYRKLDWVDQWIFRSICTCYCFSFFRDFSLNSGIL